MDIVKNFDFEAETKKIIESKLSENVVENVKRKLVLNSQKITYWDELCVMTLNLMINSALLNSYKLDVDWSDVENNIELDFLT